MGPVDLPVLCGKWTYQGMDREPVTPLDCEKYSLSNTITDATLFSSSLFNN